MFAICLFFILGERVEEKFEHERKDDKKMYTFVLEITSERAKVELCGVKEREGKSIFKRTNNIVICKIKRRLKILNHLNGRKENQLKAKYH